MLLCLGSSISKLQATVENRAILLRTTILTGHDAVYRCSVLLSFGLQGFSIPHKASPQSFLLRWTILRFYSVVIILIINKFKFQKECSFYTIYINWAGGGGEVGHTLTYQVSKPRLPLILEEGTLCQNTPVEFQRIYLFGLARAKQCIQASITI